MYYTNINLINVDSLVNEALEFLSLQVSGVSGRRVFFSSTGHL